MFFSNSSAVIVWTYPTSCAEASPNGYTLDVSLVIFIPDICKTFSFISVSLCSTFFIGTNVSSFTHDAESALFIVSTEIPKMSDICWIVSSLFSGNFPGTIPIDDTFPSPASIIPFLSSISPLFAFIVFTLTLSVLFNPGKIKLWLHSILYSLWSFFTILTVFWNSTFPALVSIVSV